MNEIFIECTLDEDCPFITRSYSSMVALSRFDDHLQTEHDTDFETEVERLEAETGQSFEEIISEEVEAQRD